MSAEDPVKLKLAEAAALLLIETGAMRVSVDSPFKLASGNMSPIYINCRKVISDPGFMSLFNSASRLILSRSEVRFDVAAGGETAGIPYAACLAQSLSVPMVYVRKAAKEHGIKTLVEGAEVAGKRALLVEDLITDAGSKLHFIEALRSAGASVGDVLVLFDRNQGGAESLRKLGVALHSVTNLPTALKVAEEAGVFNGDELREVKNYLASQRGWHEQRGIAFTG